MAASEPTSRLSEVEDNLVPLTLNQYFRTLTPVWDVPLLVYKFTPRPVPLCLHRLRVRSWTGLEVLSNPYSPIRSSTPKTNSTGIILRDISEGTSYRQARLVFRH